MYNVTATCKTRVVMKNSEIYLEKGHSVMVNSSWPFDWDALKAKLSLELGDTVSIISNDSSWNWTQI